MPMAHALAWARDPFIHGDAGTSVQRLFFYSSPLVYLALAIALCVVAELLRRIIPPLPKRIKKRKVAVGAPVVDGVVVQGGAASSTALH